VNEDITMTIAGAAASTEATFDVINPATGASEAVAPDCTPQQLDAAMASSAKAYRDWRQDEGRRRDLLRQSADALMAAADELAPILTLEQGKPLGEATFEMYDAAIWFQYYAELEIPRQVNQDDDAPPTPRSSSDPSASSPASRRGTSRSCWRRGRSHHPCSPAARWCSSPRRSRRGPR